ncbi:MAG: Tyrosine--tRNA ligase [Ignavibacteriaceae bacterium]|nr:Tyrosine--tRNA ligase [Ignavibacteriaceae bacterium]
MSSTIEAREQLNVIKRGQPEIIPDEESLIDVLLQKQTLNVKFGIDPRSSKIHFGFLSQILKLKIFQELGHRIIFIKGNFTARLGDPDSVDYNEQSFYQLISNDEIDKNGEHYRYHISRILGPFIPENNLTWYDQMSLRNFISICSNFSLSDLENRGFISTRKSQNKTIYLPEFLYPVFQAYDSLVKDVDVEIGGTDQRHNMLLGRKLQEKNGKKPQVCILYPILSGIDGRNKMSIRNNNYILTDDIPENMFNKIMQIPKEIIIHYFIQLTEESNTTIKKLEKSIINGEINDLEGKYILAKKIMSWFYSEEKIKNAMDTFEQEKLHPDFEKLGNSLNAIGINSRTLLDALLELNLVKSKSEGRRLSEQKGIRLNGKIETNYYFELKSGDLISIGNKNHVKIKIKE